MNDQGIESECGQDYLFFVQGVKQLYSRVFLEDHPGMGKEGQQYGLPIEAMCLLDYPADDFLVTNMYPVEGPDCKHGGNIALEFGDAIIGLHPKENLYLLCPKKWFTMSAKIRLVLSILIFSIFFSGWSQSGLTWEPLDVQGRALTDSTALRSPEFRFLLDRSSLQELVGDSGFQSRALALSLPMPDGRVRELKLQPSPSMHPDLQRQFPTIRSFTAVDTESGVHIRLSISHRDVQATYRLPDGGMRFLHPDNRKTGIYRVYSQSDPQSKQGFECLTREDLALRRFAEQPREPVTDQTRRVFRIAVSATGEYTAYHGGTVSDALSAINATITRINEVYNSDLGVQLQLIAGNGAVIYTDPDTDPYSSGNLISEVLTTLNQVVGVENFDLGHVFDANDAGGQAGGIGTVCRDNIKGSGFSASPVPEGDLFDIDFVAHEIGHQFGANHTFSFRNEGTQVQAEPASGTTIMAYAGIVSGNDNVANQADDYFHYYSITQIRDYLETISCASTENIANNPPVLGALSSYTIPKGTAFFLDASATDVDGDDLSFCWEQIDNGLIESSTFGPTNSSGANFRSLPPKPEGVRYFPRLSRVKFGQLTQTNPVTGAAWETVSNVAREMNFAVTVRDNEPSGGQVAAGTLQVTVTGQAGPFLFENLDSPGSWTAGDRIELLWDVAGTNEAPVSAGTVSVFASDDGGDSFPYLVRSGLPNTGSAFLQVPALETSQLRFMIQAENNVFFAVNLADQTVNLPDFVAELETLAGSICSDQQLEIPFTYTDYSGTTPTVDFSVQAPAGIAAVVSPQQTTGPTQSGTIQVTAAGVAAGTYQLVFEAASGVQTQQTAIDFVLGEVLSEGPELISPSDGEAFGGISVDLVWTELPGVSEYTVELSDDPAFSSLLSSSTVFTNSLTFSDLDATSIYYWRVKAINACGESPYSEVRQFRTPTVNCFDYASTEVPLTLPETGANTTTAVVAVSDNLPINDVNVSISATHTWVGDLRISLVSPSGTSVTLVDQICNDGDNISATFDDEGADGICQAGPAIQGTIVPAQLLSAFDGELAQGNWTLVIDDFFDQDGGELTNFSLELCLLGNLPDDQDGDGVLDQDDQCPDTPQGQEVDATGCSVFLLPAGAFAITLESESCRENNDGAIQISASDNQLTYTVELDGNGRNEQQVFSSSTGFEGLDAGSYELCIIASDGVNTYQQVCYGLVVVEPEPLSVQSQQSLDGSSLSLKLSGSEVYTIEINGQERQTTQELYQVTLEPGLNTLKVRGDLACKGVYQQVFIFGSAVFVTPNPVDELLRIYLPEHGERCTVEVFDAGGALLYSMEGNLDSGPLEWNAGRLRPGLYYLRVRSESFTAATKFVKQ